MALDLVFDMTAGTGGLSVSVEQHTASGAQALRAGPWKLLSDATRLQEFYRLAGELGNVADQANLDQLVEKLRLLLWSSDVQEVLKGQVGDAERVEIGVRVKPGSDQRLWRLPWELAANPFPAKRDLRVRLFRSVETKDHDGRCEGRGERNLQTVVSVGPRSVPGYDTLPDSTAAEVLNQPSLAVSTHPDRPDLAGLSAFLEGHTAGSPVGLWVFDGHATPGALWFDGPDGPPVKVGPDELVGVLNGRVRVALLLACRAGADEASAGNLALRLAEAGIAVVAFATAITHEQATCFAGELAKQAALGQPLAVAAAEAETRMARTGTVGTRPLLTVWQPTGATIRFGAPATGPDVTLFDEDLDDWFVDRLELTGDIVKHVAPDEHDGCRVIAIVGVPGTGKSSLLHAWWARSSGGPMPDEPLHQLPEAGCTFLRDPRLPKPDTPGDWTTLCRRIAAGVAARYGLESTHAELLNRCGDIPDEETVWKNLALPLLKEAGHQHEGRQPKKFIVLVDELDRAGDRFLTLLAQAINTAPVWVTWVCTTRPEMPSLANVPANAVATVDLDKHRDLQSIQQVATRMLQPLQRVNREDAGLYKELPSLIAKRADGLFLWAVTACKMLADGSLHPSDFNGELTPTARREAGSAMYDLYQAAYQHKWGQLGPLALLVACCADPKGWTVNQIVTIAQNSSITDLADLSVTAANNKLKQLSAVLRSSDGYWAPHHQVFIDWATTIANGETASVAITGECHAGIAKALDELTESSDQPLVAYAAANLTDHLLRAVELIPETHQAHRTSRQRLRGRLIEPEWTVTRAEIIGPGATARQIERAQQYEDGDTWPTRKALLSASGISTALAAASPAARLAVLADQANSETPELSEAAARRAMNLGHSWFRLVYNSQPSTSLSLYWRGPKRSTDFAWNGTADVAVCGADRKVLIWDIYSGEYPKILDTRTSSVSSVALSADGKTAITGHYGGKICVWKWTS